MVLFVVLILLFGAAEAMASPAEKPCMPDQSAKQGPSFPLVRAEGGGKIYEFHVTIDGRAALVKCITAVTLTSS